MLTKLGQIPVTDVMLRQTSAGKVVNTFGKTIRKSLEKDFPDDHDWDQHLTIGTFQNILNLSSIHHQTFFHFDIHNLFL